MEIYEKNKVKIRNGSEVFVSNTDADIMINDYLEELGFYHYLKDYYTKEDLIKINELLMSYKNNSSSNNNAAYITAGWVTNYFAQPILNDESLLKTTAKLFISWRSGFRYDNSIATLNEFEKNLQSRIKEELLYNDSFIIDSNFNQLIDSAMKDTNCKGKIAPNVKIMVSKNCVTLTSENMNSILYYNYEKTKKK